MHVHLDVVARRFLKTDLRESQIDFLARWAAAGFPDNTDFGLSECLSHSAVSNRFVAVRNKLGLRSQPALAAYLTELSWLDRQPLARTGGEATEQVPAGGEK